jgi:hypothetical protein
MSYFGSTAPPARPVNASGAGSGSGSRSEAHRLTSAVAHNKLGPGSCTKISVALRSCQT